MIRNNFTVLLGLFLAFAGMPRSGVAADAGSIYDLPVQFKNEEGTVVALKNWLGKKVVLTMAYTSCQYACPRIMKKLEALQKEATLKKKEIDFVIITLDPTVDTPAKLKQYRKESGRAEKNWTFLTGTEEGVRQASMVLGIRYSKNQETGMISHDNKMLLLDEKGVVSKTLNGLSENTAGFFD